MKKKLALAAFAGWTWATVNVIMFIMSDEDLKEAHYKNAKKFFNIQ